jgi:hypothetical protein
MKIKNVRSHELRNEEHFQFQNEFNDLLLHFNPITLGVEEAYANYLVLYKNENQALDVVRKSDLTSKIVAANRARANTYRGLSGTVKTANFHFIPTKKEAARRVQLVFDHFAGILKKPNNEQTAAINALIDDLNEDYTAEITTLQIEDWITELKANNDHFETLNVARYSSEADKTPLKMKEVRKEIDRAYRTITNRISALAIVNTPDIYLPFIKELNERVDRYMLTLAQRKGHKGNAKALTNTKNISK